MQKLNASDSQLSSGFGQSVSISRDIAVVGAPLQGDQEGAAFVFKLDDDVWTQRWKLAANEEREYFGSSVSIDHELLVVGAPCEDGYSEINYESVCPGYAYVYQLEYLDAWDWVIKQKLLSSELLDSGIAHTAKFGKTMATDGNSIVVGATYYSACNTGPVYVFGRENDGYWEQDVSLRDPDSLTCDGFGDAVAISGGVLIVGSPLKDSVGAAYIYQIEP